MQEKSLEIVPISNIKGSLNVPGSKSITNRALLYASLAKGQSVLKNHLVSDDTERMIDSLISCGINIQVDDKKIIVDGLGGKFIKPKNELFTGNAGTAMRFLAAISCLIPGDTILNGDERMNKRPIKDLIDGLNQFGINTEYLENNGYPPISISEKTPNGETIFVSGSRSSQYISAIIQLAPFAKKNHTVIEIKDNLVSKSYIDITIETLKKFGIQVINEDYEKIIVPHSQEYRPTTLEIEGDASSASYLLALGAISEGDITITNVGNKSIQGDKNFAKILEKMGCKVSYSDNQINIKGPKKLKSIGKINMEDMPDSSMTLAVISALINEETEITGISNLRIKECNRIEALVKELNKCGIDAKELNDGIKIKGGGLKACEIDTYNDHRMAMCFSLLGTKCKGIRITNPGCVNKTYKNYFEDLKKLGIKII